MNADKTKSNLELRTSLVEMHQSFGVARRMSQSVRVTYLFKRTPDEFFGDLLFELRIYGCISNCPALFLKRVQALEDVFFYLRSSAVSFDWNLALFAFICGFNLNFPGD